MPMGMGMAKGMGKMPPEMAKAMSKGKPNARQTRRYATNGTPRKDAKRYGKET